MQPNVQVMTPNPECAVIDTAIVDALHTMHDGKFLHLPVVDRGKVIIYGMGRGFKRLCINIFSDLGVGG